MDENIIKILEFLAPYKYKHNGDIAPILNELFPYTKDNQAQLSDSKERIRALLDSLREQDYIEFNTEQYRYLLYDDGWNERDRWMGEHGFLASIGLSGLNLIREKQNEDRQVAMHNSVLSTNKSVIATNEAMVENANAQSVILSKQTLMLYLTGAFALGSLIISYLTYKLDTEKNQLKQEIRMLKQEIRKQQNRNSQVKIDSSLVIMAEKTLTKKK